MLRGRDRIHISLRKIAYSHGGEYSTLDWNELSNSRYQDVDLELAAEASPLAHFLASFELRGPIC